MIANKAPQKLFVQGYNLKVDDVIKYIDDVIKYTNKVQAKKQLCDSKAAV